QGQVNVLTSQSQVSYLVPHDVLEDSVVTLKPGQAGPYPMLQPQQTTLSRPGTTRPRFGPPPLMIKPGTYNCLADFEVRYVLDGSYSHQRNLDEGQFVRLRSGTTQIEVLPASRFQVTPALVVGPAASPEAQFEWPPDTDPRFAIPLTPERLGVPAEPPLFTESDLVDVNVSPDDVDPTQFVVTLMLTPEAEKRKAPLAQKLQTRYARNRSLRLTVLLDGKPLTVQHLSDPLDPNNLTYIGRYPQAVANEIAKKIREVIPRRSVKGTVDAINQLAKEVGTDEPNAEQLKRAGELFAALLLGQASPRKTATIKTATINHPTADTSLAERIASYEQAFRLQSVLPKLSPQAWKLYEKCQALKSGPQEGEPATAEKRNASSKQDDTEAPAEVKENGKADAQGQAVNVQALKILPFTAQGQPVSHAYLTLWRALEPSEAEPVNRVNGATGFGYYNPVIWDDKEHGLRWIRAGYAHPNDGRHSKHGVTAYHFRSPSAGRYRVTAVSYRRNDKIPDPTPYGASEPFQYDGTTPQTIKLTFAQGDSSLVLRMVESGTRQPIFGLAVRLRTAEGMPIVHGHGSGNFFERTADRGEIRYGNLPSGNYTVQILGRPARVNQFVQYEPLQDWLPITIEPGENNVEIDVAPRKLPQAEIDKRFPFSIHGRVVDQDGRPMAGVEVRAATGRGTLLGGGRTTTDNDGKYRLYFGPGGRVGGDNAPLGVGVQAAHFFANKPGWELVADDGYFFYLMTDQPR
ncbi:MAG: carboxypeptidase regulatory-like domain-containing protein, partial [Pirellulales bacterium]|nr:carboxypeptidase regulatory-like domain-containing protein [Pirellulales bacterium]